MDFIYSPSMQSANILNLQKDVELLNDYVQMYHFDLMDANFAKNLACTPSMIKAVKGITDLPVEAHMMIKYPDNILDSVIDAGTDLISLHIETIGNQSFRIINKIKAAGRKVGIVLCPQTPLESIKYVADEIDMLTIMTVDIGFGGQKFIPQMLPKIREAVKFRNDNALKYMIQVDGGVCPELFKTIYDAGARCFVMGASALFLKGQTLEESCQALYDNFESKVSTLKL